MPGGVRGREAERLPRTRLWWVSQRPGLSTNHPPPVLWDSEAGIEKGGNDRREAGTEAWPHSSPNISPNARLLAKGRGFVSGLETGALVVPGRKEHVRSQGLGTSQRLASVKRDKTSLTSKWPQTL